MFEILVGFISILDMKLGIFGLFMKAFVSLNWICKNSVMKILMAIRNIHHKFYRNRKLLNIYLQIFKYSDTQWCVGCRIYSICIVLSGGLFQMYIFLINTTYSCRLTHSEI